MIWAVLVPLGLYVVAAVAWGVLGESTRERWRREARASEMVVTITVNVAELVRGLDRLAVSMTEARLATERMAAAFAAFAEASRKYPLDKP